MLGPLLLAEILPVFDDLYRCLTALRLPVPAPRPPLLELVEWVFASWLRMLEQAGLHALYPLRERFDPHHHEASARMERTDLPAGTITEVSQIGFQLGGRLLRPARVLVSSGAAVLPPRQEEPE